jgi:hypothetical protein
MHLHTLAIARPPGGTLGAVSQGRYVFGAAGVGGAYVADILDPADVRSVRTFPQLTDARQVAVSDRRLYIANGSGGLAVADMSDPAQATVTGTVFMPGAAVDVVAVGTRAYVANDALGLVIVDAGRLNAPRILGIENTPGKAVAVAVRGTLAFVADETDGLRIINIADPTQPFILKTVAIPDVIADVAVDGDRVAVAASSGGLQVVDVSDPAHASIVGSFATVRGADAVAIGDGVAYVAASSGGFDVIDVTAPDAPRRIQTVGTPSVVLDVALAEGRLTVAENLAGARVVDVRNPAPPATEPTLTGFNAVAAVVMGDYVVVADGDMIPGVLVIDATTNAVAGGVATSPLTRPTDIAIADSIAYVASGSVVPIIDLHDPTTPVVVNTIPVSLDAVAVHGRFLFVARLLGAVTVLDLDNVTPPANVTINNALLTSIAADDDYAYVTDRRGKLLVLPRGNMAAYRQIELVGSAERVLIRREDGPLGPGTRPTAYVAEAGVLTSQASVESFDLSDVTNPVLLWRAGCGGKAQSVDIADGWMVVGEGSGGMEMFAVDATGARPVGFVPGTGTRAAFVGSRIAIARGTSGVTLVPIDGCRP